MYLNFDKQALGFFQDFSENQYPFKLKLVVFEPQNRGYYQ